MVTPDLTSVLSSVSAFIGGILFGAVSNWEPSPPGPPKRYVTFDPEEDDKEFDRQLEETVGTSKIDTDD